MTADLPLAGLSADARRLVPHPPGLDEVTEDAGRQRLATYYLYSALMAGLIGPGHLAPARWPPKLAEPMQRLGLTRLAPVTGRGLDAGLTPAEQAARRSPGRELAFAHLLVDLVNRGGLGPLCAPADKVRLADRADGRDLEVELLRGDRVVGTCKVADHWELVAQHLAGAPLGGPQAAPPGTRAIQGKVARELKDTGIAHAVSLGTTLAVSVHPLGAAAGLGTRLVRSRLHTGTDQAEALRRLGRDLSALAAAAEGEVDELRRRTSR
jgi:hypothetical protein